MAHMIFLPELSRCLLLSVSVCLSVSLSFSADRDSTTVRKVIWRLSRTSLLQLAIPLEITERGQHGKSFTHFVLLLFHRSLKQEVRLLSNLYHCTPMDVHRAVDLFLHQRVSRTSTIQPLVYGISNPAAVIGYVTGLQVTFRKNR